MREIKFRAWDGKNMLYDYQYFSFFHGQLVCEGDTIPMQYTGLKDKNGVEIYEGDIVTYREASTIVEWNDGHSDIGEAGDMWGDQLGWQLNTKKLNDMGYYITTPLCSDMIIEVIGNIYENPELLK